MTSSLPAVRVVKVGGSLLQYADLPARLQAWFARQLPKTSLVVVGGGALADTIRQLDERFELGPTMCHELAVETMAINARIVMSIVPEFVRVEDIPSFLEPRAPTAMGIVDPVAFVQRWQRQQHAVDLPASWSVTSDSIAACLAHAAGADELALLKSCLPAPPAPIDAAGAAARGFVDLFFPNAAAGIETIRAVNLRAEEFPELRLQT